MDRRAIGKGRDKLNTQTKYQWTSTDFSFAEITIMARRKILYSKLSKKLSRSYQRKPNQWDNVSKEL